MCDAARSGGSSPHEHGPAPDRDMDGVIPNVNDARRDLKDAIKSTKKAAPETQRRVAAILVRAAEAVRRETNRGSDRAVQKRARHGCIRVGRERRNDRQRRGGKPPASQPRMEPFASPGQSGYTATDLSPGRYIALCFLPTGATPEAMAEAEASGHEMETPPHAMMGMTHEFTVA